LGENMSDTTDFGGAKHSQPQQSSARGANRGSYGRTETQYRAAGRSADQVSDMARRVQASVSEAVEPANQKYAPSCDEAQWRWISWSSTFAAISWLIVSFLFSYYTSHFGCYNKTYGSLGAVLDS